MEPQPQPETPNLTRLASARDLARERFGESESLAVVRKTTLDLAKHYADKYGLDQRDPEVTVITVALAQCRHKEFLLMQELERELHERVLTASENMTYSEALFRVTKSGGHTAVHKELTRLHGRAKTYHDELGALSDESLDPVDLPGTP